MNSRICVPSEVVEEYLNEHQFTSLCECGVEMEETSQEVLVREFDEEAAFFLQKTYACRDCSLELVREDDFTEFVLDRCGPEFLNEVNSCTSKDSSIYPDPEYLKRSPFCSAFLQLTAIGDAFESGEITSDKGLQLVEEVLEYLEAQFVLYSQEDPCSKRSPALAEVNELVSKGLFHLKDGACLLLEELQRNTESEYQPDETEHSVSWRELIKTGNSSINEGKEKLLQFEEAAL